MTQTTSRVLSVEQAGALLGLVFAWWTGSLLLSMLPSDAGAQTLSAVPDQTSAWRTVPT